MFRLPSNSSAPLVLALAAFLAAAPVYPAAALSQDTSGDLRPQAAGPVKWLPWGEAAFARAKQEQKPIYLFIGTATSELARAMVRQSFANPEAAALLNDNFVCVMADIKEQPELTALYQNYLQTVKQLKGLPMNLWLTPELKPFEGSTYLPPTEEWGKEGFLTVTKRVIAGWKADPAAQRIKAAEAVKTVAAAQQLPPPAPLAAKDLAALLTDAGENWRARFDAANGGFGDPPKYPEPELLRFLLRAPATRDMALATLRALATGAVHDPLDGGFFRYATDAVWRQPYLQKSLVDQARLALAFLDAAQTADEPGFREGARGALNYALDRLATPTGELAAAEDATPEKISAHYYWTLAAITDVLGEPAGTEFARVFGATAAGNLAPDAIAGIDSTGKNVLYRAVPPGDPAAEKSLAASAAKLLQRRDANGGKPQLDETSPSGAHGLLLAALSRAGAQLKEPRFTAAARTQFAFIRDHLLNADGELRRLADAPAAASPQDYALVIDGLASFQAATGDAPAGRLATALLARANARLFDPVAGRYFGSSESPAVGLWTRVHSADPAPGEAPAAGPAMLVALAAFPPGKAPAGSAALADKLAAAIAADVRASADAARGDQLLALGTRQSQP